MPAAIAQENVDKKINNQSPPRLHVEGNILAEGPWANLKAFGAIGDGTTDDALGIQAAIRAMASHGGTIYFPPGIYRTTVPVLVEERDLTFIYNISEDLISPKISDYSKERGNQ